MKDEVNDFKASELCDWVHDVNNHINMVMILMAEQNERRSREKDILLHVEKLIELNHSLLRGLI